MKVRRRARALALQALYEIDSTGHSSDRVLNHLLEDDKKLPAEGVTFAIELVNGVLAYSQQLDTIIQKHAPEWPVEQLAIVDRNILRMALYELQHIDDVPIKVAVNEAVELAKTFGSDTSPRFVNGVLGAFLLEHPNPKGEKK
ncbi:MAG: transcription antitermination factor NusB [Anaerolineae bacterium]|nr:transcription antitermination factor NusB [Anaerolineae bacterium]